MIVVASSNADVGMKDAMDALQQGGSAIDAVEAGIKQVELNPDDHTVGINGFPNLLGELELDASIMEGRDLMCGSVAAMKNYAHPISVARKVMETLPHVFLAADGAERFAHEMGFQPHGQMYDDAVAKKRADWLKSDMSDQVFENLEDQTDLWKWAKFASDAERAQSTVNVIAMDADGNIASGVSTSGWAWKYPGRVGDTPIIGAGNYVDNRFGAAACTGMGEMAIRAATAHSVVIYLKMGVSLEEAGRRAMNDLNDLGGDYVSAMNMVVLEPNGDHAGFTSNPDGKTYIYQTADMDAPNEVQRQFVAIAHRWPSV
jgi:beta-aspartyl-peptidase (threonine type)